MNNNIYTSVLEKKDTHTNIVGNRKKTHTTVCEIELVHIHTHMTSILFIYFYKNQFHTHFDFIRIKQDDRFEERRKIHVFIAGKPTLIFIIGHIMVNKLNDHIHKKIHKLITKRIPMIILSLEVVNLK